AVTKVVTFGAFVEILDGVEGLVHISELPQHHVENPREGVQPGDTIRVKVLEIDSERRRLSLSVKRVEGQVVPRRTPEELAGAGIILEAPSDDGLSEDEYITSPPEAEPEAVEAAPEAEAVEAAPEGEAVAEVAPEADAAPEAEVARDAEAAAEPEAEAVAEPEAEAVAEPEAEAVAEPEAEA